MQSKVFIFIFIIIVIILGSLVGWTFRSEILRQMSDPSKSLLIKLSCYSVFTILTAFITLPMGIISKVLAGWLFGFELGSIVSHLSLIFGSWLAFSLSRYLGKEYIKKKIFYPARQIKSLPLQS